MASFIELRDRLFEHYSRREYREALDLVERFEPADRGQDEDLRFWRMCLQSRLGETDQALVTFAEALDHGHWWSETMLGDSDLDLLRDLSEWQVLLEQTRDLEARGPAPEPEPIVLPPTGPGRGNGRTLVVLHGAGSRPEVEAEFWTATEDGWTLVAPQSTQRLSAAGRYGWRDLEKAKADVVAQLEATGRLSEGGPVVGGFSQGAGLAAHLVCSGTVAAEGLVMVAPTFHWGLPGVTAHDPVPSWILLGSEEDPRITETAEELGEVLEGAGWPVEIERPEGLGHSHPSDFEIGWPRRSPG